MTTQLSTQKQIENKIIGYQRSFLSKVIHQGIKSVAKISEMSSYTPTIGELIKVDDKITKEQILLILAKYLSANVKGKSISTGFAIELILDHITNECSNLELQELDFLMKQGVLGSYGTIYNDIGIDTICGKEGWIESYYETHRKNRPEAIKKVQKTEPQGKIISREEFYKRNPKHKDLNKIWDIRAKATNSILTDEEIEFYFKYVGIDLKPIRKKFYEDYKNRKAEIMSLGTKIRNEKDEIKLNELINKQRSLKISVKFKKEVLFRNHLTKEIRKQSNNLNLKL